MWKAPEPVPCARHRDNITRLRCSHCEKPICPECMVQTEVGFKCPDCINQQQSHLYQVTPAITASVLGFSLVVGYGYGYLHMFLWMLPIVILGIPILGIIAAFALGQFLGRTFQGFVHYKRHPSFWIVATLGFLMGLWFGPYQDVMLRAYAIVQDMVMSGAGNVLETGASSIYRWLALAGDFILPFMFYDGYCRAFKIK